MPRLSWLQPSGPLGLLRGRTRAVLFLTALFKALEVIVFAPVAAGILGYCLLRWGRCSVGNFEIAAFFLSLPGLIAVTAVCTFTLACAFLEITGLSILLANRQLGWRDPLAILARRLCDRARARGIDIHPWTINDVDMLAPLLDRGVANVITDNPASMRKRLEEIERLGPTERLLLRARNLLAD
jgi:hypothetical protein